MTGAIGSIIISGNPVTDYEDFLLNLSPTDAPGYAEARFSNYAPLTRAEGGWWATTFAVFARELILKELYENALGRDVEVWGYGLEPNFEGRIEELVFALPPDRFTKSLRTLANKAHMRADVDGDGEVDRSTVIENTESQGLYGTAEGVMSGGQLSSSLVADQTIQSLVDLRSLPQPAVALGGGSGGIASVELVVRGYITTLGRRLYNQTLLEGTQSLSSQVEDVIDDVGEFIESIDTDTNTTAVTQEYDVDRKADSIVFDLPRLGDSGNNRWLLDCYGRDCTTVIGRRAYLHQAAPVRPPTA